MTIFLNHFYHDIPLFSAAVNIAMCFDNIINCVSSINAGVNFTAVKKLFQLLQLSFRFFGNIQCAYCNKMSILLEQVSALFSSDLANSVKYDVEFVGKF